MINQDPLKQLKKQLEPQIVVPGLSIPLSKTARLKLFDLEKNAIKSKMITTTTNMSFSKAFKERNIKLEIKQIQYKA